MIWTIQEFVADRKRQRKLGIVIERGVVGSMCLLVLVVQSYFWLQKHHPSAASPAAEVPTYSFVNAAGHQVQISPDPELISDGHSFRLLVLAVDKWSREIGLHVTQPRLYRIDIPAGLGWQHAGIIACSSPSALACYESETNRILLPSTTEPRADLFSILLHEVGHSIGVPHIEDDPLMQADTQVLDFTDRAIPIVDLLIGRCKLSKACP